jgi:hypothetical protein
MVRLVSTRFPGVIRRSATVVTLLLSSCVFVPKKVDLYDSQCETAWKQMELESVQIAAFGHCHSDCASALVVVGAVAAASVVVSGSIVVVGNVVYWLEKQGRCLRKS